MVLFIVGEDVNGVFCTTKTEQTVQKQGKKVRVVTYHAATIRAHYLNDK